MNTDNCSISFPYWFHHFYNQRFYFWRPTIFLPKPSTWHTEYKYGKILETYNIWLAILLIDRSQRGPRQAPWKLATYQPAMPLANCKWPQVLQPSAIPALFRALALSNFTCPSISLNQKKRKTGQFHLGGKVGHRVCYVFTGILFEVYHN